MAKEPPLRHGDPDLLRQMRRLYYLRLRLRWGAIALAWLVLVPPSLWSLRGVIARSSDYFGWATLRYAIAHHRLEAIALAFCIALVTVTLLRHSWHMFAGISQRELTDLRRAVLAIRDRGPANPLWRWVVAAGDGARSDPTAIPHTSAATTNDNSDAKDSDDVATDLDPP